MKYLGVFVKVMKGGRAQLHCPSNNLNLRIQIDPVIAGSDATVYVSGICLHKSGPEKSDVHRCVCSSRDKLGYIYAEIWNIFGTV